METACRRRDTALKGIAKSSLFIRPFPSIFFEKQLALGQSVGIEEMNHVASAVKRVEQVEVGERLLVSANDFQNFLRANASHN